VCAVLSAFGMSHQTLGFSPRGTADATAAFSHNSVTKLASATAAEFGPLRA
jgi:hypothetical protein